MDKEGIEQLRHGVTWQSCYFFTPQCSTKGNEAIYLAKCPLIYIKIPGSFGLRFNN